MTTQIKAKLLQHFAAKKKADGGFTLIELLVVIIIIGILSAIALPSFLNQANKAKQSEAKTYIGSMNRAQQAYYLENGNFAFNGSDASLTTDALAFSALGLGITPETENYSYAIGGITGLAAGSSAVNNTATPSVGLTPATGAVGDPDPAASVKQYFGTVKIGVTTATAGDATTLATLCEALTPPISNPTPGMYAVTPAPASLLASAAGAPECGAGFKAIQ